MELLCIFAALAVLFLFCAFLTLKCNLHAALAPLSALGIAVAWLTAAGMANLLLPGTVLLWAVFAGSGVWALVPTKASARPTAAWLHRGRCCSGAWRWHLRCTFSSASRWQPSMMNSACGLPP